MRTAWSPRNNRAWHQATQETRNGNGAAGFIGTRVALRNETGSDRLLVGARDIEGYSLYLSQGNAIIRRAGASDQLHIDGDGMLRRGAATQTSSTPVHREYEPVTLVENVSGGRKTITYTTRAGKTFTVQEDSMGMVESISGTSLQLKQDTGIEDRGYTGESGRRATNEGHNSSHLIADQFGGSGYKRAANLITTSSHYNQTLMAGVERQIRSQIVANNANEFDMTVSVKWTELRSATAASALANNAFREANAEMLAEEGRRMTGEERAAFIAAKTTEFTNKFTSYAARVSPNLKRCKETKYDVDLKRGGNKVADVDRTLGEDVWLGAGG